MSVGTLSREDCGKCQAITLHDRCICIHCGTLRPLIAAIEPVGMRAWRIKWIQIGNRIRQSRRRQPALTSIEVAD